VVACESDLSAVETVDLAGAARRMTAVYTGKQVLRVCVCVLELAGAMGLGQQDGIFGRACD